MTTNETQQQNRKDLLPHRRFLSLLRPRHNDKRRWPILYPLMLRMDWLLVIATIANGNNSDDYDDYDSDDYEAPLLITTIEPNPHYSLEQTITSHSKGVLTVARLSNSIFSGGLNNEIIKSDQQTGQVLKRITNVHANKV